MLSLMVFQRLRLGVSGMFLLWALSHKGPNDYCPCLLGIDVCATLSQPTFMDVLGIVAIVQAVFPIQLHLTCRSGALRYMFEASTSSSLFLTKFKTFYQNVSVLVFLANVLCAFLLDKGECNKCLARTIAGRAAGPFYQRVLAVLNGEEVTMKL